MFKSIFITSAISLLSIFAIFTAPVTLDINVPESANGGGEFLVEVTIEKGNVEGFARFQQELPVGFVAVERNSANGKFTFQNQTLKIQWMNLPYDQTMTISYAIQVAPTVSGDFNLGGKFSYILDNSIQAAELSPKSVKIIANESAAALVDDNKTYTYQNVRIKKIDCIRQKPYTNSENEIVVKLLVNKANLTGFGKIQEQVPPGYVAKIINGKKAIFTFANNIAKFLWMNMPPENQFVVAYKLIPEGDIPEDQAFLINGTFAYVENDRTHTLDIAERKVDLSKFSDEELIVADATPQSTPSATPVVSTPKPVEQEVAEPVKTEEPKKVEAVQEQYVADVQTPQETSTQVKDEQPAYTPKPTYTEEPSTGGDLSQITDVPKPEYGVAYRVQVAAGHRLVGQRYFKQLNITDYVQTEIHNGWHKYTVGNFAIYKDARDYRMYIWNNTPVHDAFVAAYNNGLRITVQEALMISNQKWYK